MNVLVLMADHFRYDAMGRMGNPFAHTPNLDRLAAQSVCFDSCYCQSPLCGPARHSLATGQYVHRHGVLDNRRPAHPGMYTIAHAVKAAGYRRHQNGHMHWHDPRHDRGEDVGYEAATATKQAWRDEMPADVLRIFDSENEPHIRRTTAGPGPRTARQHWGYKVATESIRLMREAVDRSEPFLSWTSFTEPHPAFRPPKEMYELNDPAQIPIPREPAEALLPAPYVIERQREWVHLTDYERRQMINAYYGMVALVDGYIGIVLDALEELGIRENTIVIFTADHGEQLGEHGLFLKRVMYEGSVHVPLMISVPGVEAGTQAELVEHVDLFPTICDLLGVETPASVQGRSLVPLLQGETPERWRDAVFSQDRDMQMIRTRRWKLNVYAGKPEELYDLKMDPGESYNRIRDAAYTDQTNVLVQRLQEWAGEKDVSALA